MQACDKHESCLSNCCKKGFCAQPAQFDSCSTVLQNCPSGLLCHAPSMLCMSYNYKREAICKIQADCTPSEYCQAGSCVRRCGLGSHCSFNSDMCEDGLMCFANECSKRCSAAYPCGKNQVCRAISDGDAICQPSPFSDGERFPPTQRGQLFSGDLEYFLLMAILFVCFFSLTVAVLKTIRGRRGTARAKRASTAPVGLYPTYGETHPRDSPPPYSATSGPVLARIDPNIAAIATTLPAYPHHQSPLGSAALVLDPGPLYPHMPFK